MWMVLCDWEMRGYVTSMGGGGVLYSKVVSSSTISLFSPLLFSQMKQGCSKVPLYISHYIFHYIFEIIVKIWNLKGKRFWPLEISNRSCEVAHLIFGTMNFREVWLRLYFFKCFLTNCGLWDKLFQWNCPLKITKCTLKKPHNCLADLSIKGGNMLTLDVIKKFSSNK